MLVAQATDTAVAPPAIRMDRGTLCDVRLDKILQAIRRSIRYSLHPDAAYAFFPRTFSSNNDEFLALGTSSALTRSNSADHCLIDFNFALEQAPVGVDHRGTDLME
jgi:hypothetical protein